jgi:signal transduction histidine kinase
MVGNDGNDGRWWLNKFFRDPENLRYRLGLVVPIVTFLTSILTAVTIGSVKPISDAYYAWILALSVFSALCIVAVTLAVTQPLKELITRAQQLLHFQQTKSGKSQMLEVYELIEKLMELARSKQGQEPVEQATIVEGLERLDYLLPLGYMSLMVAHEVRNPLSTITGMTELLKEKVEDPQLKTYLQVSLDAAKKIDVFTKELLDFTDNEIFKERFDLNVLVEESVKALALQFKDVECVFDKGSIPLLEGDRNKIYQAIHNILKNAFEYEREGGLVRVTTGFDETIHVLIYNRSSRVDAEHVDTIFKPFFTKKKGGRGIGLFVSMRNIKLHGGTIEVESDDKGTTFKIGLPLAI